MGPVWEDADGEEIVNETFTRLEKAFHAIFSERDAVESNLLRASVTSTDCLSRLPSACRTESCESLAEIVSVCATECT